MFLGLLEHLQKLCFLGTDRSLTVCYADLISSKDLGQVSHTDPPRFVISYFICSSVHMPQVAFLHRQFQCCSKHNSHSMFHRCTPKFMFPILLILCHTVICSPTYVPPMSMPGYSSNPTYPHSSTGSNYLLMPGGSSHLSTNGLKYGIQQFKPVPTGSTSGLGTFTSLTGYAVNTSGVIGSTTGVEDSSRLKYKDNNLYVPNPQRNGWSPTSARTD
uniref:Uncharacterized protein LOC104239808 isoform X3 n=1 Tax=Nicotiana sylvestris TaxID=4096 RepID=A0A1U7XPM0_NICSY|nr:PREDICTED: uncharacterized protein LOC104239808 isoform X3 [Nicotiana sylvestris]